MAPSGSAISAATRSLRKPRTISKIIYVLFLYDARGGVNNGEPRSAELACADGGGRRAAESERREPRGGDRRHRRHLPARREQQGAAVRRHSRLPARLSRRG